LVADFSQLALTVPPSLEIQLEIHGKRGKLQLINFSGFRGRVGSCGHGKWPPGRPPRTSSVVSRATLKLWQFSYTTEPTGELPPLEKVNSNGGE
jgi:hypothetical protein